MIRFRKTRLIYIEMAKAEDLSSEDSQRESFTLHQKLHMGPIEKYRKLSTLLSFTM